MGWVNLNDVYLSKSGDTMTGALTVKNNLTVSGTLNNGGIVTSYGNSSSTTGAQRKKIFTGSIVKPGSGNNAVQVWNLDSFRGTFGKAFSPITGDIVVFMNGDASGSDAHIEGSTYTSSGLYAVLDRSISTSTNIRINFLIVLQN